MYMIYFFVLEICELGEYIVVVELGVMNCFMCLIGMY